MQIPKILNVVASDHKLLTIVFTNGEKKIYDVSRLWDNEMFAPLKNPSFFKNIPCRAHRKRAWDILKLQDESSRRAPAKLAITHQEPESC
jgi:hypothetical protein